MISKAVLVIFMFATTGYSFKLKQDAEKCLASMDLVLVLDSSDSLKEENVKWKDVQGYAKKLVDDLSDSGIHVGIIHFGSLPKVDISLSKGAQLNAANIKADINGLALLGGKPYIDKALAAANNMFTDAAGMRTGVPKVCIFITPGIQAYKEDSPFDLVESAAQPMKDKDVQVFSLGIGDDIDVMNLIHIATTPDNVFSVRNNHEMVGKIKKIKQANC